MHAAAAALADVFGELAFLRPGDNLVFTVRAGHVAGGPEGDDAFVTWSGGDLRGLEPDGMALAACDGAGGAAAGMMSRSLAGGEQQGAECADAEDGGADECRFHNI